MAFYDPGPTQSLLKRSTTQRQCLVCSRFRCPLRTHREFVRRLSTHGGYNERLYQIDDEKLDPFAKHPIPMTRDYERVYAQGWLRWDSDFQGPERHMFPYSRYTAVFKYAWHDEALHYGMLSLLATQISMLRDGKADELALDLQSKAIDGQRKALEREEYSDARVMTALCIMSNAFAINRSEDLSAHMRVIIGWLQKRGGLRYLGFDGVIADNLLYGDHTRAVISNQLPHYSVTLPAITSTAAPEAGKCYNELRVAGLISYEAAMAANDYTVLNRIFDRAATGSVSPSEATYFAYLANVVEYQLACANALYRDTNTLDEIIVLACLLGNVAIMRNYGQISPLTWTVESRFWVCLERLKERKIFDRPGHRSLEWYLTCTGVLTATRGKCQYEQRVLQEMVRFRLDPHIPLKDFHQLCSTMDDYGWCKNPCLPLFSRLWHESSASVFKSQ